MQKLGIVIPAYNEDRQVIRLVKEINKKIVIKIIYFKRIIVWILKIIIYK